MCKKTARASLKNLMMFYFFFWLQTSEKPEVSVACTPHSVAADYRDDDETLYKVRQYFISRPFINQIYVMTDLQQNIIG